jgi:hypothetical protein
MGNEGKSYVALRRPDGTYIVELRRVNRPATTVASFPTLSQALDECARLSTVEDERRKSAYD